MKMFFKILVTRKVLPCLGWAFEVLTESLEISTIYWWMNKLFDYMLNVTLLNLWYDRSRSKIGVISEIMWAVRFVFEITPDISGFFGIFVFSWIYYVKWIKANLAKYVRYLYLKFLIHLFVSKSFYNSVDIVQLDR